MFKRSISLFLSFTLLTTQSLFAQGLAQLNLGSYLSTVGTSISTDRFRPLHMRYFLYDQKADNFQLLLDKGDNKDIKEPELQEKTKVLMEYFLIGLSLPNDKLWVNLRPDAQDEMIDPELEKTDMGKIMLEADLQLKRDTAQATSPQTPEGKVYWDKLYKKAGELFGTENITIPTITRPWIVPGEVILRQGEDSAYIFKANMKVMLEHDYLNSPSSAPNSKPLTSNYNFSDPRMKELNEYSSQLIRELIIPKLTKEVNSSKRYASLRQVFFSLVMARWFKDTFKDKSGQYSKLIDSHNLNNLTSKEAWDKTYYFNEYKKSFEQGEYNLKENITTPTGQVIRSYVSGGMAISSPVMTENAFHNVKGKPVVEYAAAGYESVDGRKKFYVMIDTNGKGKTQEKTIASSALIPPPYDGKRLDSLLEALNTNDTNKKISYLQILKDRLSGYYSNFEIREIIDNVMPYLAEKNEKNKELEEARVTKVAADILNYISGRERRFEPEPGDSALAPNVRFLTANDIESIKTVILNGIEFSVKPYLASQALRVILFRAMNSNIPYVRQQSVSLIGELAELLIEGGTPEEIKTQFLKQVEGAGAINIDQGKIGLEIARAIKEAQKSLIALQKSMRGSGSAMIETRPAEDADLILFKQSEKRKKDLEEKLWVTVRNVEEMLNEEKLSGRKNRGEIDIPEGRFKGISKILNYLKTLDRKGTRIEIKEGEEANGIDEIIRIISETGLRNDSPQLYWVYSGLRLLSLEDGISELEGIKKDWQEFNKVVSSAMETVGGIDFRTMNYLVEPMGSFKDLRFGLPVLSANALERIDLDKELAALRDMVKAGLVPSGGRVKEYLAACFQKGKMEEKQDDLLACLAEIYRLAEEENLETSPELRESLVIVDTGKFVLLSNNQKADLS